MLHKSFLGQVGIEMQILSGGETFVMENKPCRRYRVVAAVMVGATVGALLVQAAA